MFNSFKTAILLGVLTGLILLIGEMFGGRQGLVIAFIFALLMNGGSYWFSDKIVLSLYRARELKYEDAPDLHRIVESLSQQAEIPKPRVYIIPSQSPNAFATGRNPDHAALAVTEGILSLLNHEELQGVISHELSHIKNRDILIGSIAATLAGVIMMLASMARWAALFGGFGRDNEERGGGLIGLIAMSIFAPLAAMLIQLAISRSREYLADETGANISKNPRGLASALEKLSIASKRIPLETGPAKAQATSHMFIVNPLHGKSLANLFSTHPSIEDRIKRLNAMAGMGGLY
ncbi:MAG TPA: zinc metalloprotease HtpX [Desulfatiglandales bacterium]|nr:zinc metalloprotease HtpX [Desulfatiglandales bacterium]